MALIALHNGVCADQRETVLVILDLLDVYLPAFNGVAALAIGSELAAMDICVALGALGADLFEHQAGVALRARNLSMHTTQRIASLVVIELRVRSDRFPGHGCVTVLTGCGDRAMRIGHLRLRSGCLRAHCVSRHVQLQSKKGRSQTDCYRKYPPKPIQRVSPPSPRNARQVRSEPQRVHDIHNQPTSQNCGKGNTPLSQDQRSLAVQTSVIKSRCFYR